jgi:hypothetical protein
MDLELLIKEYDTVLLQYNQLNSDYLNYIKNTSESTINTDFTNIPNSEYSGINTSIVSQNNSSNITTCSASCSTTTGCTGATFNQLAVSGANNCSLKSGDGKISSKINSSAIVTKKMYYLARLKILNDLLISINQNIQNYIDNNKSDMASTLENKQSIVQKLFGDLNYFVNERDSIEKKIKSITDLDNIIDESDYSVYQKYLIFRFLAFIAVLAIFILIYLAFFDSSKSSNTSNTSTTTQSNSVI